MAQPKFKGLLPAVYPKTDLKSYSQEILQNFLDGYETPKVGNIYKYQLLEALLGQYLLNAIQFDSFCWHIAIISGSPIVVRMAQLEEFGELLASVKYHWWKQKETDEPIIELNDLIKREPNIAIELVDMTHFILTEQIVYAVKEDLELYNIMLRANDNPTDKSLLTKLRNFLASNFKRYIENSELADTNLIKYFIPSYFKKYIQNSGLADTNLITTPNILDLVRLVTEDYNKAVRVILSIVYDTPSLGLAKIYWGKLALNVLRFKYGIASGAYIKHWEDNKEDNEFMLRFARELKFDDPFRFTQELYNKLKDYYTKTVLG